MVGRAHRTPTKVTSSEVYQLAFSPDGRLLAVSSDSQMLWDVDTRKRVGSGFPAVKGWVPGIAFEPDGKLLIFQVAAIIEWRDLLPSRAYRHVCPG